METKLLLAARGGRVRVEVTERTYSEAAPEGFQGRTERAYSVKGAGVRDGSFYTDSWTAEQAIERALACYRSHRPKAALRVSWCVVCRDKHAAWEVHEGRPSWHQQRAGAIGAAVSSGYATYQDAEAHANAYRARTGEPAIVLQARVECQHKV